MNIAASGKLPHPARLATMGLNDKQARAIVDQMNAHVRTEPGLWGRTVKQINLDEWTDDAAHADFIVAVDKWSRRVVQQNDIGQYANWMTSDFGRVLIQFRSFTVAAYEKQLLFNIARAKANPKDWESYSAFMYPLIAGGLSYMAMTHVQSLGRKDRKEFLERQLALPRVAAASFQRGAWSSIIPMGIDTITSSFGFDPAFSARTTGLETDALVGNATFDLAVNGRKVFAGLTAPFRNDYDFSQENFKIARKLWPYQAIVGIRNGLDAIQTRLPKQSEDRE